jgi:hypothetical protein
MRDLGRAPDAVRYADSSIKASDLSLAISLVPEICYVSGLPMIVQ